jgi:hypothetical protein
MSEVDSFIKNTIFDIRDASFIPCCAVGGLIGCYVSPEVQFLPDQSNKEYVLSCSMNICLRSSSAVAGAMAGYVVGPMVVLASPFLITTWLFKRYS